MTYWQIQRHNLMHLAISLDQLARMLVAILTGTMGWSDETLSAYAHRAAEDGKMAAKAVRAMIDVLFAWQATDPAIIGADGKPIRSHCHRAFEKERQKSYLPREYL